MFLFGAVNKIICGAVYDITGLLGSHKFTNDIRIGDIASGLFRRQVIEGPFLEPLREGFCKLAVLPGKEIFHE
jgi:hypothetical protein